MIVATSKTAIKVRELRFIEIDTKRNCRVN